jgi:hypothetical protein
VAPSAIYRYNSGGEFMGPTLKVTAAGTRITVDDIHLGNLL